MRLGRSTSVAVGLTLLCASAIVACYRWHYPYGIRSCFLPCMVSALSIYAADHEDRFPDGGTTPQEALRKLVPKYVSPSMLAGLTGKISDVTQTLRTGGSLTDLESSWVYQPGFKQTDDPRLAIIWERVAGISFNGRRAPPGSHAVGFADGTHRQVSAAEWNAFEKEQAQLREEIHRRKSAIQTF